MSSNEETYHNEGNHHERSSEAELKCDNPLVAKIDSKSISSTITYKYLCGLCISILSHVLDVGTDIYLAYQYFLLGETIYFTLTACFIIFPSLIITLMSIRMYANDNETVSRQKWIFRGVMLILQFAPLIRYIEVFCNAIKLKRNKNDYNDTNYEKFYKPLLIEDSNLSLLRLIECFLEGAPQQVLQWTILLRMEQGQERKQDNLNFYQYMTISTSLLSTAWCFALYNRSVRFVRDEKINLKWISSSFQIIWLFSIISARILALSEVASVFPQFTIIGCIVHWFVMTLWLSIFENTWFCYGSRENIQSKTRRTMEVGFSAVLGVVFIFAFLTVQDGNTRYKYIFYYTLCFMENSAAIYLWSSCSYSVLKGVWWYMPLLITTCSLFFVGICSMIIYYKYYHPKIGEMGDSSSIKSSNELNSLNMRRKCDIEMQVDV